MNSPALSLWIVPTTRIGVSRPALRSASVNRLETRVIVYDDERISAPAVDRWEERSSEVDARVEFASAQEAHEGAAA
eukprot:2643653-Pleurochrysis_carterae.AAC.1